MLKNININCADCVQYFRKKQISVEITFIFRLYVPAYKYIRIDILGRRMYLYNSRSTLHYTYMLIKI